MRTMRQAAYQTFILYRGRGRQLRLMSFLCRAYLRAAYSEAVGRLGDTIIRRYMASQSQKVGTMRADCQRNARTGVADMTYIERRLDSIEARIDDLCGLLGEVLERIDKGGSVTELIVTKTRDNVTEIDTAKRYDLRTGKPYEPTELHPMDLCLDDLWGDNET